jgi:hypothetical protein
MTRHTARVSRTGLVIVGLILLLGGGAILARSRNASPSVLGSSHATVLSATQAGYPAQHSWVWPAVAAACVVIAVLALWWLAAQTSTKTVRRLPLEPDRVHGATVLRADAVTGAIVDELENYPSIRAADAALRGSALTPGLRLAVTAENRADPARLRTSIESEALANLRAALELDTLPTVLRLQFSRAFGRHLALSAQPPRRAVVGRRLGHRVQRPHKRRAQVGPATATARSDQANDGNGPTGTRVTTVNVVASGGLTTSVCRLRGGGRRRTGW